MIMNKKYFLIPAALFLMVFALPGIYDYSFTTIEGGIVNLSSYQNKKIVIVTLPVMPGGDNNKFLERLDSISAARQATIKMIGVPSYEDGYTAASIIALRNWYRSKLGAQFIVATGMYTRKASGSNQHIIFKWLTDKNKNGHFDMDVNGAGQQFFIATGGDLYGILGPEAKWNTNIFNRLVQ